MNIHRGCSCHHSTGHPQVADRDDLQVWRIPMNILNKQSQSRGGLPAWWLGEGLTTYCKKSACYEMLHKALDLDGLFETM